MSENILQFRRTTKPTPPTQGERKQTKQPAIIKAPYATCKIAGKIKAGCTPISPYPRFTSKENGCVCKPGCVRPFTIPEVAKHGAWAGSEIRGRRRARKRLKRPGGGVAALKETSTWRINKKRATLGQFFRSRNQFLAYFFCFEMVIRLSFLHVISTCNSSHRSN